MEIEFDSKISEANAASRGLPFGLAAEFDWITALGVADIRATPIRNLGSWPTA